MSNNKELYEVAQMMRNRDSIQSDMREIREVIANLLQKKYLDKFSEALKFQQGKIEKDPSREVQLLRAVKAFSDPSKHDSIEKMIDSLLMIRTIQNTNAEIASASANIRAAEYKQESKNPSDSAYSAYSSNSSDPSIHKDGIYDIDQSCIQQKKLGCKSNDTISNFASMMIMMSLLNSIRRGY